jgi:dCTP deaminase
MTMSTRNTGVLPIQAIRAMIEAREIAAPAPFLPGQLQPASLDLRLGRRAWRVHTSFLPGRGASVAERVARIEGHAIDLGDGAVFEKGCVYVVELQETLDLPAEVSGSANPKSSTGRLDVLTRLITDRSSAFDQVECGYSGPLYVEVAPRTFSIVVRPGTRLNQLRFYRGGAALSAAELDRRWQDGELVRGRAEAHALQDGLVPVTIDLKGRGPGSLIGYRAKKHARHIDLELVGHYDPQDFWEPIHCHRDPAIILDPDDFYILVTDEEVRIPPDCAAEMVAYHTRSGEYRVHYAGFFDPGFGWDISKGGSRAVLEVRSHEVPFMLEHGQPVGWLRYEWMAGLPDQLYGSGIGSNYQGQGLALAKQFRR